MQPGWYPDPDDDTVRRYYDGATWSAPLPVATAGPPPLTAPPEPSRSPKRFLPAIIAAAVLVAAGAFAIYWFAIRSTTMTVRGSLDLMGERASGNYEVDPPDSAGNTYCHGVGGYSDISEGVAVKVTSSDGKTIGTGALEGGIYIKGAGACIFGWQVTVPDDGTSYGVTVSHRGTIQFTKAQMKAGPDLTLGED